MLVKNDGSVDLTLHEVVNTMPSILFVCTGNIFRSLTAEYALKARLDPGSPLRVSSAGTVALPQDMHPDVHSYLVQRGGWIPPTADSARCPRSSCTHRIWSSP
jgi:Low molecular weight phosphotyrosine protein phosphatase